MAVTQYIGSRYVPLFADPAEWSSQNTYEPLTIVLHQGNSYTSKQAVPKGIAITNEDFWALTGNYNAQIEQYRRETADVAQDVIDLRSETQQSMDNLSASVDQRVDTLVDETDTKLDDLTGDVNNSLNELKDDLTEDYYYDEIEIVELGRAEDTDYYVVKVPLRDSDGNIIQPTMVKHPNKNPLDNAIETGTTLSINGSASVEMQGGTFAQGTVIGNGEILNEHSYASDSPVSPLIYNLYLCFDESRTLHEIPLNTNPSAQSLISAGYKNVFQCYAKLASNGIMQPISDWEPQLVVNGTRFTSNTVNPMMLMGITISKDLYFLACDGRTLINRGLKYQTAANVLISLGCKDVYMLDGGGSTCMVYRGSKINRNIDGHGTVIRDINYSLTFNKNTVNDAEITSFGNTGFIRQLTTKQLLQLINRNAFAIKAFANIPANSNLNDYTTIGKYACTSNTDSRTIENNPFGQAFDLYVMQHGYYNDMVMQVAVSTSHSSDGYKNLMAFRFVDTVDPTSISPYVSNWSYVIDNHPVKISLGLNESFTFNYIYNRPVMQMAYRMGNSSTGLVLIEYNQLYSIAKTGTAFDEYITIDYDTTNRTITITNTSSGRFNAILSNGYWND